MKRTLSMLMCLMMALSLSVQAFAANNNRINAIINDTADYIYKTVPSPQVGSIGGEWVIFGLARSEYDIPDEYYINYYKTLEKYVKDCNGILSDRKYTEYSRVIIALTAMGKDPTDVAGYNLLTPLGDYEKTIWQGLNGPIWALLALDSGGYEMPQNSEADTQATRDMYVDYILDLQLSDGGWSLSGKGSVNGSTVSDPDVTGMALAALSKYKDRDNVNQAIETAVRALSEMQNELGGYSSWGSENSESAVQVMVALCELSISIDDNRFIKNGNTLLDNVLSFYQEGIGFKHTQDREGSDRMATEQGFYGLAAVKHAAECKSSLYRINDNITVSEQGSDNKSFGLPDKNQDITYMDIRYPGKTFIDISAHENKTAIEALSARGIINGRTDTDFEPDATMTRAEFAAIIVRGLGLSLKSGNSFADIAQSDWYFNCINTAHYYGIVSGISDSEFNPNGTITREEAAALCGMTTDMEIFTTRDILAGFIDYVNISQWAVKSIAFCYETGILDDSDIEIKAKTPITRAEIAQMLFNMMGKAELL